MNIINKCTLESLKKNKVRTLVTVIGIILSVAMFTAVTTLVASVQQYMIDVVVEKSGSWHGSMDGLSVEDKQKLEKNEKIKDSVSLEEIGYGKIKGIQNESKPYLYIVGADSNITTLLPIKIISGKMPEKQGEILLPKHLSTNGGVDYQIGDILEMEIGNRFGNDGQVLRQNNSFEEEASEQLGELEKRTYTVVGFYERPSFEAYSAPGYTALTVKENNPDAIYQTFFTTKKGRDIYEVANIEKTLEKENVSDIVEDYDSTFYHIAEEDKMIEISCQYNKDLLRCTGDSNNDNFNTVLYSMAGILVGIIMLGSVSLIYNAFSISIGERTKQFGLLKSIGATKRQIRNSVFFEAFLLCVIGLPLGLLAGIAGIGITLYLLEDTLTKIVSSYSAIHLHLVITWQALVVAAIIGMLTVMISAYLPAKRAMKMNAIEAIRQSHDIKLSANQLRSPKWFYKVFGLEGMMAQKYFRRNKKRYRATIISLFFSIVIFISTSSFCVYMTSSVDTLIKNTNYDIVYYEEAIKGTNALEQNVLEKRRKELMQIESVDSCNYTVCQTKNGMFLKEQYTKEMLELYEEIGYRTDSENKTKETQEKFSSNIQFVFLDDETFLKYLQKEHLDTSVYINKENPTGLIVNLYKAYNPSTERYQTAKMVKQDTKQLKMFVPKKMEGYYGYIDYDEEAEEYMYTYIDEEAGDSGEESEEKRVAITEKTQVEVTLNIGADVTKKLPDGMDNSFSCCTLIYPYSMRKTVLAQVQCDVFEGGFQQAVYSLKAKNHAAAYKSLTNMLKEEGKADSLENVYNAAEQVEITRAMIMVTKVFSYGFIILISLIAVANVFNTISTNIQLRRREFAMLKSVGMTQKGLLRMMDYECVLYGVKSLFCGIPVAAGITYLIYRGISEGWETKFFIPWNSVAVAVVGVFTVVFSTMLYAMNKIRKENVMEELKRENV